MVQVNLRLAEELYARVEEARGDVPRNRWLVRAVERALEESGAHQGAIVSTPSPAPAEQPSGSASRVFGWDVPLASGPAEQPDRRVSPSKLASPRVPFRRDVKPFQRGGS